jgi:hypothetical protein
MSPSRRRPSEARRPRIALAALTALAAALGGCHLDEMGPEPSVPHAISLSASPDSVLLPAIGSTFALSVTAILSDSSAIDAADAGTYYATTDAGVAGAAAGVVRAAGDGTARIVAERDGVADTVLVTVDESAPVPLDSVRAAPDTLRLPPDGIAPVAGIAVWANGARLEATGLPFAYASSDPAVVTVSTNGGAHAGATGSAVITLTFRAIDVEIPVTVAPPVPTISYVNDVEIILQSNCTFSGCHPGSGPAQRDLRLNSYAQVMAGGTNGPVVTPGNGAESRIIRALRGTLPSTRQMPLGRPPLIETTLQAIETWIDEGALDN